MRWGCGALALIAACGGGAEDPPRSDASIAQDAAPLPVFDAGDRIEDAGTFYVRAGAAIGSGTEADPFGDLQRAIDQVPSGARIVIEGGTYTATPAIATEPQTRVQYTTGFVIRGKYLAIEGSDRAAVRIESHAGYGLSVEDAPYVSIAHLTISEGTRDDAEEATSGGIVARNSTVRIDDVRITGNTGLRPGNAYPGISGIVGREGARLLISAVKISGNSWDGVAIYNGAQATIVNSDIEAGDGIGLSARGDGSLFAINNRVSGYWRGIAGFDKSAVVAKNNQLFDLTGAGAWAAGDADSVFQLLNNVISGAGNCGFAIAAEARGRAHNNIVAFGGAADPWLCPKAGVWSVADATGRFGLAYNLVWSHGNAAFLRGGAATGAGGVDISAELVGAAGNLSADPRFTAARDFRLSAGSPAIDSGDPTISDLDGSRSDLGFLGGPDASRTMP